MFTVVALASLLAVAAAAPPAAEAPASAVPSTWLDAKSRLTNGEAVNVCLTGAFAQQGLKPSRLAVPPMKKGRMLVGFPAGALYALTPTQVQGLSTAIATCLSLVLDPKDARKLGDDAVKQATIRALFRIAEGDTADAPEWVIDATAGRMVPIAAAQPAKSP